MILIFLKTTIREILCFATILITTNIMFLTLPNEKISEIDFSYINFLLCSIFLLFYLAGYINFYKSFNNYYNKLMKQESDKLNLDGSKSFYAELINMTLKKKNDEIIKIKENFQLVEKENNEYVEGWVHEIKTPISVCELIVGNKKNEDYIKISTELDRINFLVNQVIYSARINDINKNLKFEHLNLNKMLKKIILEHMKIFISKNIAIDYSVGDESIINDEKWITYIFTQIINNCAKYTKQDGIVSVKMKKSNYNTLITIKNECDGILQEELPKIFDKGFVGKIGKFNNSSTGMGLYLAKKASDIVGIDLYASSKNGEYFEITISILNITKM